MVNPGEVYLATIDGAGQRPIIVISREGLNRGNYLLGVPCTSRRFEVRKNLPNCVPFSAGQFGFSQDCVAQCELITTVRKADLGGGPIGILDEIVMRAVIKAIGHVLDSDCEPN